MTAAKVRGAGRRVRPPRSRSGSYRSRPLRRSLRGRIVLTFSFWLRLGGHFDGRTALPLPVLKPSQVLRVLPLPPPVARPERTRGLVVTEQDIDPQPDV